MHYMTRTFAQWRTALGLTFCAIATVMLLSNAASASETDPQVTAREASATSNAGFEGIDVVQLDGLIDPPNASLLLSAIDRAEKRGSTLLVLQIDSPGVVGTDAHRLAAAIANAKVPIASWVGPAGAEARGGAAMIASAAPYLALASNATIGPNAPYRLDLSDGERDKSVTSPPPVHTGRLAGYNEHSRRSLGAKDAQKVGAIDATAPVIGDLIVSLNGKTIATKAGPKRIATAEVVKVGNRSRLRPNQEVRFRKLSINGQVQHTLGTPWAAYFLFALGGCLLVLEFFSISIGIGGVVGAFCLIAATFGFSHLPVNEWAVALLLLAFLGYAIDIQAGGLGPWTVIGTASFVAGSVALYGGSSDLDPSWWIIVLVTLGVVTFMLGGMTAMLRSRFSTPTVGREGMIGELGTAEVAVSPDGLVRVRETVWKARTNRATPINQGDVIRVVAVEGLVLEVEPEAGGAKDYRDRSPKEPAAVSETSSD